MNYDFISWYWTSFAYGSTSFYPCCSDGITPFGQPACDGSIYPPAYIESCPQIFLPVLSK